MVLEDTRGGLQGLSGNGQSSSRPGSCDEEARVRIVHTHGVGRGLFTIRSFWKLAILLLRFWSLNRVPSRARSSAVLRPREPGPTPTAAAEGGMAAIRTRTRRSIADSEVFTERFGNRERRQREFVASATGRIELFGVVAIRGKFSRKLIQYPNPFSPPDCNRPRPDRDPSFPLGSLALSTTSRCRIAPSPNHHSLVVTPICWKLNASGQARLDPCSPMGTAEPDDPQVPNQSTSESGEVTRRQGELTTFFPPSSLRCAYY